MKRIAVHRAETSGTIADRVGVADSFWLRARGLLGRPRLEHDEGLLIHPCRAVHTLGMRYPIDVAFLDERGIVVATYPGLLPNRRTSWHSAATYALELMAGTLERTATSTGHGLRWGG